GPRGGGPARAGGGRARRGARARPGPPPPSTASAASVAGATSGDRKDPRVALPAGSQPVFPTPPRPRPPPAALITETRKGHVVNYLARVARFASFVRSVAVDTSALRDSRDYRVLVLGGFVSGLGSQVTLLALPFQVSPLTTSSCMVGLIVPLRARAFHRLWPRRRSTRRPRRPAPAAAPLTGRPARHLCRSRPRRRARRSADRARVRPGRAGRGRVGGRS